MKYNVIIADDEELCRSRLRRLLHSNFPEITILAEAEDGPSALALIDKHRPNLVFLDIEMPGSSGLEVAAAMSYKPFIIFVTAHNSYAIEAFKTMAIDYILKPITADRLRSSLEKLQNLNTPGPDFATLLKKLSDSINDSNTRLCVKVGDGIKFIPFDQIICFEADQKYTTIFTSGKTFLSEMPLVELERILPPKEFFRIHRKHIINMAYVDEFQRWFNHTLKVILRVPFEKELFVSRNFIDKIQSFLKYK